MSKDGGGSLDLLNIRSMAKVSVIVQSFIHSGIFPSLVRFQIANEIGPQIHESLMKKVQLSKGKQASWGHANERLLFDDDNFV